MLVLRESDEEEMMMAFKSFRLTLSSMNSFLPGQELTLRVHGTVLKPDQGPNAGTYTCERGFS